MLAYNGISGPDVKYSCEVSYDPFLLLQKENKVYGEGFRWRSAWIEILISIYRFHRYRSMSSNQPYLLYGLQWKVRIVTQINHHQAI